MQFGIAAQQLPHYKYIQASIPSKKVTRMFCEKLTQNQQFTVNGKEGMRFSLHNIALDLDSTNAALFLINGDKEILIAELSRNSGGVRSMNLCLEFGEHQEVILFPRDGTIHLIGGYKSESKTTNLSSANSQDENNSQKSSEVKKRSSRSLRHDKIRPQSPQSKKIRKLQKRQAIQQKNEQAQQNSSQPISLRRSSRSRAPPKPVNNLSQKAAKREKQYLKSMGNYYGCDIEDDDEDEDESFEEVKNVDQDDEDEDDQDDGQFKIEQKGKDEEQEEQVRQQSRYKRKLRIKTKQSGQKQVQNTDQNSNSQQASCEKLQTERNDPDFSIPKRNPYSP